MRLGIFKKKLQTSVEKILHHRVYCFLHRKHGHQAYADIGYSGHAIRTVFDIGANVGQTAMEYMVTFPRAKIYCFEPVSATFAKLQSNLHGLGPECHRLAFGSEPGRAEIYLNENSLTNSLIPQDHSQRQETVEVSTVDSFARANGVEKIDLLKIDTEGFDLEVLKGARDMLSSGAVLFTQVELGFHPCDKRHVLFDDVRDLLMESGFSVFGIYDQYLEWTGEQRMRFANAVFHLFPAHSSGG